MGGARAPLKERRGVIIKLCVVLYRIILYYIFLPVTIRIISSSFILFFSPHDYYKRRNQKIEITFLLLSTLVAMNHPPFFPCYMLSCGPCFFVPRRLFYFFFFLAHSYFKPILQAFKLLPPEACFGSSFVPVLDSSTVK